MGEKNLGGATPQNIEEINRLIDGMTLFDDDLMSKVFDKILRRQSYYYE